MTDLAWKIHFGLLQKGGTAIFVLLLAAPTLPLLFDDHRKQFLRQLQEHRRHSIALLSLSGLALLSYWLSNAGGLGLIFILPFWLANQLLAPVIAGVALLFAAYSLILGRMRLLASALLIGVSLGAVSTHLHHLCRNTYEPQHCEAYHRDSTTTE